MTSTTSKRVTVAPNAARDYEHGAGLAADFLQQLAAAPLEGGLCVLVRQLKDDQLSGLLDAIQGRLRFLCDGGDQGFAAVSAAAMQAAVQEIAHAQVLKERALLLNAMTSVLPSMEAAIKNKYVDEKRLVDEAVRQLEALPNLLVTSDRERELIEIGRSLGSKGGAPGKQKRVELVFNAEGAVTGAVMQQ